MTIEGSAGRLELLNDGWRRLDQNGEVVYQKSFLSQEIVVKIGRSGYVYFAPQRGATLSPEGMESLIGILHKATQQAYAMRAGKPPISEEELQDGVFG